MFERTLPGYARAVPTGRRKGQTEVDPYADPMSGADPEPTGMPWHRRVVEEVIRELATDPEAGLTRDEARSRLADHGPNLITTPRRWAPTRGTSLIDGGSDCILYADEMPCIERRVSLEAALAGRV